MSSAEALADGVQALFPASVRPFFGHVPDGTTLPWSFVLISIPGASGRRMDGRVSTRRCVVRVRIAAGNDTAARRVWDNLRPEVEGVRPAAVGWDTSPLSMLGDEPQVFQDRDVKVANQHPIVCAVDFEFMASEVEESE